MTHYVTRTVASSLVAALMALPCGWADVTPHCTFTDNMVLQQGIEVPVWGTGEEGERVEVKLGAQSATTKVKDGKWLIRLRAMKAGGPHTMAVVGRSLKAGRQVHVFRNVLIGEVWICSGQSNMQFSVQGGKNAKEEIEQANWPQIRLLTVPRQHSDTPLTEFAGSWQVCTPKTVAGFSAVGYFFGRALHQARKVPVGLINASWGGTPAETWTRRSAIETDPFLFRIMERYQDACDKYPEAKAKYEQALAQWPAKVKQAKESGKQPPRRPRTPYGPEHHHRPGALYNAMIAPLIPYAIKGALWYQGESNAGRAWEYKRLFAKMIDTWRKDWAQADPAHGIGRDFPFLLVQLAPFMKIVEEPTESAWAELREAQVYATRALPNVGQAVIIDAGEENNIHPKDKQTVGARLAVAARGIAYGENLEYSGPLYSTSEVKGNEVLLSFTHVGRGLCVRGDKLTGFTVAGKDGAFVNADAEIRGDRVAVWNSSVNQPAYVRYGWANYPVVNLWNLDGLPASPFRTDFLPMTTDPRRTTK